ncbi:MAG TPA: methyltransferase domain-containing protein [Ktedonobacterales bacterium]|nr:methyltransferase domain-containing protein [Ktedonobacterales bacterium]
MTSSLPERDQPSQATRLLNRLHAQTLLSWKQEQRLLSWYGLQDGMSVLEAGSGPGFFTAQLVQMLPASEITCVDTNAAFLAHAKQLLPAQVHHRVRLVEASILSPSLPEQTFDFAIARFLFQHLASPVEAAQTIWRLLKPGGKLVIIDSDDALFGLIHPPVPELPLILERYGQAQAMRGGNRQIGRHLWRILRQAGFLPQALDTIAFHSDELGLEAFQEPLAPSRFAPLVQAGLLPEDVFASAQMSADRFFASPERFILLLHLCACGQRPAHLEVESSQGDGQALGTIQTESERTA